MKALLLATSETEKLRPLTERLPAPMLPVCNRPVITFALETLLRAQLKQIHVALYHLGGSIEAYLGDGSRWGATFAYSLQREPFGSAGACKWAQAALNETFVVLPGDTILVCDLAAALQAHRARAAQATCILHAPRAGMRGEIALAADGALTPGDALCFTGAYIFEPRVLELIPARTPFDLVAQLIPALSTAHGFVAEQDWNPLATFADYQAAQADCLARASGDAPQAQTLIPTSRRFAPGIWVGREPAIHPSAQFAAPVCIGDDCLIGRNVELGPNVVIGNNVIVEEDVTMRASVILDNTYVGKLVNIENRVVDRTLLIDTRTAEATQIVDRFLLAENSPLTIGNGAARLWDAVTALIAIVVTLPLTLLVALGVLLTTGGVLTREPRIGTRPGDSAAAPTQFGLWRFRTRAGSWLSRWDLDRLPELWNVLRGDLSWVGVKPLTPDDAARVTEDWQRQRFVCPAGFTGLWYTQTARAASLDEILIADTYYAATRTWRQDVQIFARTFAAWRRRARE